MNTNCYAKILSLAILLLSASGAYALDWTQPILDEKGAAITDWPSCPGKAPDKPAPDNECTKPLTIGLLAARALLVGDQSKAGPGAVQEAPEQKALEGRLGLAIIDHPDLVPTPDQLKLARDAIGRLPSPLAVARAWDILDKAVK
jgi:hypothetical protein